VVGNREDDIQVVGRPVDDIQVDELQGVGDPGGVRRAAGVFLVVVFPVVVFPVVVFPVVVFPVVDCRADLQVPVALQEAAYPDDLHCQVAHLAGVFRGVLPVVDCQADLQYLVAFRFRGESRALGDSARNHRQHLHRGALRAVLSVDQDSENR
jgi:hypothetical protein